MVFRLDDTDVERNTEASVQSIFEGLKWLGLELGRRVQAVRAPGTTPQNGLANFRKGTGLPRLYPCAYRRCGKIGCSGNLAIQCRHAGISPLRKADRRASAGETFALRFRVPREEERVRQFADAVYGEQTKAAADIEDFALLRSDGMPTYHLASCADDVDLHISHIIRGQDHLSNTFKHVLIFEARRMPQPPQFAHLPLLVAPGWNETLQAQTWSGGQRHHVSRCRIFA